MAMVNDRVIVLHRNRSPAVDFCGMTIKTVVNDSSKYLPKFGCTYKDGFLYKDENHHRRKFWNPSASNTFVCT